MPENRKESFVFSVLMCAFMVFIMSVYNVSLYEGLSWETVQKAWLGFPLAYAIAFCCDWFFVARPAKKLAFSFLKPEDSNVKKGIIVSTCMVCGMVIMMSLYGAVMHFGISRMTLFAWLGNIPKNFILAYPLQLIVARPVIQHLFRKAFPVGCITVLD